MSIRRVVPDITNQIHESGKFYTGFLELRRGYVTWIGLSRLPCDPAAQITLVQKAGSAEPQPNMTIEVDDVDAVHAKAVGTWPSGRLPVDG